MDIAVVAAALREAIVYRAVGLLVTKSFEKGWCLTRSRLAKTMTPCQVRVLLVAVDKLSTTERLEAIDLGGTLAVQRTPQVPILLQPKPEVGGHSDHPRQP